MAVGCPISLKKTNSVIARLNAAMAVVLVLISLWWPNIYLPLFLTIDFFILGFLQKPSPRSLFSKALHFFIKGGQVINAGPKIFAAKIGFWASLTITVSAYFAVAQAYYAFAIILTIAALLEAVFEFCLGCKIYPHWHAFVIVVNLAGVLLGFIMFSRVMSALLRRLPDFTLSAIIGIMCGCLRVIWPFRTSVVDGASANILPDLSQSGVWFSLLMMVVAGVLVLGLQWYDIRHNGWMVSTSDTRKM